MRITLFIMDLKICGTGCYPGCVLAFSSCKVSKLRNRMELRSMTVTLRYPSGWLRHKVFCYMVTFANSVASIATLTLVLSYILIKSEISDKALGCFLFYPLLTPQCC